MEDKPIKEISDKLNTLTKEIAVMSHDICSQGKIIDKMSNSFEKLTIFIEKTNENNKKITALFKELDRINTKGTQNCPVNANRLTTMEKHMSKLDNYLISVLIAIVLQVFVAVIYLIEHHFL